MTISVMPTISSWDIVGALAKVTTNVQLTDSEVDEIFNFASELTGVSVDALCEAIV